MNVLMLITTAGEIVQAASTLKDAAEPLVKPAMDSFDKDAFIEAANTAAAKASETAGKAKEVLGSGADAAQNVFRRIADSKNQAFDEAARKRAEKELRKVVKDLRQRVLENATTTITISNYLAAKEKASGFGPISSMPGCFVIATYKKLDFDKDLTDFIGIYVGKADNVADGVDAAISKAGNPDVYADVKYKQNVHIYVYNCLPENVDEQYESLLQTFDCDEMY